MEKYKNLEQWKEELVGKVFGRLTVIDVQPHIRETTGKKDGYNVICVCTCGNKKEIPTSSLIRGLTQSCGCLNLEKKKESIKYARKCLEEDKENCEEIRKKLVENLKRWREDNSEKALEIAKHNIEKAQEWHRDHPEESRKISLLGLKKSGQWRKDNPEKARSILEKATLSSIQWRKDNPEKVKESIENRKQWYQENKKEFQEKQKDTFIKNMSKEENELYNYLISLGYRPEQQFLLEYHFFDFRINDILIEYHGSIYHYTEYENLNNSNVKEPPIQKKGKNYHKELKELANRNGFILIQVWDYMWFNNKEFVQKLLKEQLSDTANYKDYLEENSLLNNDYGFNIYGEQVEPKPLWVSTWYRKIVNEEYSKGKVLVYNSGYTKIKGG